MSDAVQKLIKDQAETIRDLKRKNFNLHKNYLWFGIICVSVGAGLPLIVSLIMAGEFCL